MAFHSTSNCSRSLLGEQWKIRQASLWALDDPLQQGLPVAQHACDRLSLEEIRVVLQATVQSLPRLPNREGQIKLAGVLSRASGLILTPASSPCSCAACCSTNMTWKSGERLRSRSGSSSSTTFSNGISW